ncbi:hypothetical protein BD779DRAFT_1672702 [Infundibulicybe gibba]|nr:hypothetical protein BD779DRAFT_1672702 [Infundibulicybe gibba]
MVAAKTAKTQKLSYTERVLGAFTQVQKEHRRQVVHLATLRAQIKKTAQARKDKLGPQWSNWVGKAVHKLEDEGILMPTEPAGSITLTKDGKKRSIAAARQSLAIPANATPTPTQQDLIWKHVITQQASNRGVKRPRRSSIRPRNQQESDEEDVPITARSRSNRPKRPRTSTRTSLGGKKTVTRMTKAELTAELHSLQQEYAQSLLRAESPLTDLDDEDAEETARLKAELLHKQQEIEAIRRELAEARAQPGATQSEHQPSSRPVTPEPTSNPAWSSPSGPVSSRPPTGVVRTQSGSLISGISKQPTPAPSSPGVDGDDDFCGSSAANENGVPYSLGISSIVTPASTPRRSDRTIAMDITGNNEEQYNVLLQRRGQESSVKFTSLEQTLNARVLELRILEDKFSQLQREHSQTNGVLLERDSRITDLQKQIESLESQAAERAHMVSTLNLEISTARSAKQDLDQKLAAREKEVDQVIAERDGSLSAHATEKSEMTAQISSLRETLHTNELAMADYAAQTKAAEAKIAGLNSELEVMTAGLETARLTSSSLQQERDSSKAEIARLADDLASINGRDGVQVSHITQLEQALETSEASRKALTDELTTTTAECSHLSDKLDEAQSSNESLLQQLTAATDEKSSLKSDIDRSQNQLKGLREELVALGISKNSDAVLIEGLQNQLLSTEANLEAAQTQISESARTLAARQAQLDGANQTTGAVQIELAAVRQELHQVASQYDAAQTTIAQVEGEKTALKSTAEDLVSKLASARDEAIETKTALITATSQLKEAKEGVAGLTHDLEVKDSEMNELRKTLSTAESTAGMFRNEVAARDRKIQELAVQLEGAQKNAEALEASISTTEEKLVLERVDHKANTVGLQELVTSTQAKVETLGAELDVARKSQLEATTQLKESQEQLSSVRGDLAAEQKRAGGLETDLTDATGKLQEAEEEITDLNKSKAEDASTIETLKDMFAKLRESQMRSLAELDNKVISAHSSPAPKRRSSRVPAQRRNI